MTSVPAVNASWPAEPVTSRPSDHVMTGVVMVVGALSMAFNAFLLVVFARNRLLRTVNNSLVANLAVSDLLYVITACFVVALSAAVPAGDVTWARPLCRSSLSLLYLFYAVSGNACMLISFHRFTSIVCPHRRLMVRRHSAVRLTFLLREQFSLHNLPEYLRRRSRRKECPWRVAVRCHRLTFLL